MQVNGSRVGIVGGSIAGCATAVALSRLGCDVQVYERSSGALQDRGSGIAIPLVLRDQLIEAGYLPRTYPSIQPSQRHWVVADGGDDGQLLWQQPSAAAFSNWGILWRSLRAAVPEGHYTDGAPIAAVANTDDGATIEFADGTTEEFDIVIGADGYRSEVRRVVDPTTSPEYAGYILWRGNFPEAQLSDRRAIDALDAVEAWLTVGFDGGHGIMYTIPDFDDGTGVGRRRINWAIYAPQPEGLSFDEPTSIPPGAVSEELDAEFRALLDRWFPPALRPLFDSPREELSIQPIYDELIGSYVRDHVVLIGDAGTVTRPHTGSGATKAMEDALALETLGAEHSEWSDLLAAYDANRSDTGRRVVELGRRIGRDQVENTPPWASMAPEDFESWTASSLSGESLYFYGNSEAAEPAAVR